GDWNTIRIDEFRENLSTAQLKLRTRKTYGPEETEMRDLVSNNIEFVIGKNTFLIDNQKLYGTKELLSLLLHTYGSEPMQQKKLIQLNKDISTRTISICKLLEQAEIYILRLAQMLHDSCSSVVQQHISQFNSIRVAS